MTSFDDRGAGTLWESLESLGISLEVGKVLDVLACAGI